MTRDQDDVSGFWREPRATALLVLANGLVLEGTGLGAAGEAAGEVCFNTAMTGYQEILTDPSYAGQIVTFTFPHIGNVGANDEDVETSNAAASDAARGAIVHAPITNPSNYRSMQHFNAWLRNRGIIGLCGVDTRALTAYIRERGMQNAVIAHATDGIFDIEALHARAAEWPGLEGMDLVPSVASKPSYDWTQTPWTQGKGYGEAGGGKFKVVAIDYGVKSNILRLLTQAGCDVTVAPSTATAEEIFA